MNRTARERGAVCGALVLAAAALLGTLTQPWARVAAPRQAPLGDIAESLGGRSLAPALGGAGLVVLAGAVAVLATSGWARRAVGALLVAAGAGAAVLALRLVGGPGDGRARELIADRTSGVGLGESFPVQVSAHPAWPIAAAALGLLIAALGAAVAVRGPGWSGLAARYDGPRAPAAAAAGPPAPDGPSSDLALWTALDRGDDPTGR